MTNIVYVDEEDNVIGAGSKENAVERGIAHRIARVYVFNSSGQLLLQRRSPHMHSAPDKWDDSAAGHVDEGEDYLTAATRELAEELGIKGSELAEVTKYYTEETELGRFPKPRKRFNTLYRTVYDGQIKPDESEVAEVRWIGLHELKKWLQERPDDFTHGFRTSLAKFLEITNLKTA